MTQQAPLCSEQLLQPYTADLVSFTMRRGGRKAEPEACLRIKAYTSWISPSPLDGLDVASGNAGTLPVAEREGSGTGLGEATWDGV